MQLYKSDLKWFAENMNTSLELEKAIDLIRKLADVSDKKSELLLELGLDVSGSMLKDSKLIYRNEVK